MYIKEVSSELEAAEAFKRVRSYDQPFRCFITMVDEAGGGTNRSQPLVYEGARYADGTVRLFGGPLEVDQPRRAIVILLDETPEYTDRAAPRVSDPISTLVRAGDLEFDLADASGMGDEGEYVHVDFSLKHKPPFLILTGKRADDVRAAGLPNNPVVPENIHEPELTEMETRLNSGEPLTSDETLRLISSYRNLKENRNGVLRDASAYLQMQWDHSADIARSIADGRYRQVKCDRSNLCQVRADGSCQCNWPDTTKGTLYRG